MKFVFGDCALDEGTRQLLRCEREVRLSPKAFELLAALLRARPRALSKVELHAQLWPDTFVSDANLAMLVAEVRRAIDDHARAPRFVRTVQRHGYAFHGIAEELTESDASRARSTIRHWMVAPFRQIPLMAGNNLVGRDPNAQDLARFHRHLTAACPDHGPRRSCHAGGSPQQERHPRARPTRYGDGPG